MWRSNMAYKDIMKSESNTDLKNSLKKRSDYHKTRQYGLSPFCSLGEGEESDLVVYNGVSTDNFDYSSVDLYNSKEIGLHCGTEKACRDRGYKFVNKLIIKSPKVLALDFDNTSYWASIETVHMMANKNLFDKKQLGSLEIQMKKCSDSPNKYEEYSKLLREFFLNKGYNVVSYPNAIEDKGSTSYIILDMSIVQRDFGEALKERANGMSTDKVTISFDGMKPIDIYKFIRKEVFSASVGDVFTISYGKDFSGRHISRFSKVGDNQWKYGNGTHQGFYSDEDACFHLSHTARDNREGNMEVKKFRKERMNESTSSDSYTVKYRGKVYTCIDTPISEMSSGDKVILLSGRQVTGVGVFDKVVTVSRNNGRTERCVRVNLTEPYKTQLDTWQGSPFMNKIINEVEDSERASIADKSASISIVFLGTIGRLREIEREYNVTSEKVNSNIVKLSGRYDDIMRYAEDTGNIRDVILNENVLKEAPDMFGYMTDDEMDADDQARRDRLEKELADRRARTVDKRNQWQRHKPTYDEAVHRFKNGAGKVLEQLAHKFESGKLLQWSKYETPLVEIYKQYGSDRIVFKPIGTNKKSWLDTINYSLSTGKVNFNYYKDDIGRYLDAYDQLAKIVDSCASVVSDWVGFIEDQNKQSTDKAISRFLGGFVDNPSNIDCAFDCSNPGHYAHGCRYYIFSVDGKVYHYEDYDSGAYTNNHVHQIRCFDRIDIKNYVWDESNPILDKVDPSSVGLSVKGDLYGSQYFLGGVVSLSALTSGKGTPTEKVVRLGYYTSPDKVRHSVYFYSNERDAMKAQSHLARLVPDGSVQVNVAGQTSETDAKKKGFTLIESSRRKKKKGIHINKDAGNVEHNINMFNMANNPVGAPCNNPVSGPMGGNVGCCESLNESSNLPERAKLISALKTFDRNGKVSERGSWKVANGGYDLAFEVYYKGQPVAQGMSDGKIKTDFDTSEFGFTNEDLKKAICSVYSDMCESNDLTEDKTTDDIIDDLINKREYIRYRNTTGSKYEFNKGKIAGIDTSIQVVKNHVAKNSLSESIEPMTQEEYENFLKKSAVECYRGFDILHSTWHIKHNGKEDIWDSYAFIFNGKFFPDEVYEGLDSMEKTRARIDQIIKENPRRFGALEYDRDAATKFEKEFDVMSPQEVADNFGREVKDGDDVYSPKKKYEGLDDDFDMFMRGV